MWQISLIDSVLLLLCTAVQLYGDHQCVTSRTKFYKQYSTKTPYQYIVDDLEREPKISDCNCENVQIWSIIRHGTRYPSEEAIKIVKTNVTTLRDRLLESNQSKLCPEDLELLKAWNYTVDYEQAKKLHAEGVEELIFMGERLLERYPKLLTTYHENDFIFRTTKTERARRSGESLVLGLFSNPTAKRVKFQTSVEEHDPLIRFYKLCRKWLKEVKKNPVSRVEFDKFSQSSYVDGARRQVSDLFGFEITVEELDQLYVTCNFDQAWQPRKLSPWCTLFSDQSLEVMEYREDLEYYWVDGPGHAISYLPSCVLIQDVMRNFANATAGLVEERGIFYFTHSGTLLKLLAYLGTHNDKDHLTSENFSDMKNRKWRTSYIGPFATNVSFLLRKCGNSFSVCLLVNEKPERLPGCDSDCCPWDQFVQLFSAKADSCDFDAICENKMTHDGEDYSTAKDDRY